MKGLFITLYGINNIGKSTQAKLLVERLKEMGAKVVFLKYPIYDLVPTGPQINKILRGGDSQKISEEELQKLFYQNRKDFEPTLKKHIAEGNIVIAEDYTGTGIAWGTAKGADQTWLEELNQDLLKEDLAILLIGKRHMRAKEHEHIHESNDELVEKVAEVLKNLADKYGWEKLNVQDKHGDTSDLIYKTVASKF